LEGLVVGHDLSSFKEGESVILTLADSSVLDDNAPMELENANLADADRLKFRKARQRKLNKPLYSAYDDDEDGEDGDGHFKSGLITKPKMLAHYDQEDEEKIVRERKRTVIGRGGKIDPEKKKEAEEIAERLRAAKAGKSLESIKTAPLKVAREYMTAEEVTSFKKKKKKKKKKSKKHSYSNDAITDNGSGDMSLAEELEARALAAVASSPTSILGANHGTRGDDHDNAKDELNDELEEHERQMLAFNKAMTSSWKQQKASMIGGVGDRPLTSGAGVKSLARKMAIKRQQDEERENAEKERRDTAVLGLQGEHVDDPNMILSDTVQFTTQLKSRILQMAEEQEKLETQRAIQQEKETQQQQHQQTNNNGMANSNITNNTNKDNDVVTSASTSSQDKSSSKNDYVKHREPLASSGLAASLQLLRRTNNLGSNRSGLDVAYSRSGTKKVKTEVTSGKVGDIKYEHRDSKGNLLTTQEAWRALNYVFHGINPGKKKLDKRKAKMEAAKLSQSQSANEKTQALNNTLKYTGQAFISLQGGKKKQ
jgi:U4/U6.U5 tri-snRNP-associated protein 1